MSDTEYTSEQVEMAKDYLRRRLENEVSMVDDVERLLTVYARRLVGMIAAGASQDDIDALVEELIAILLDDCEILAVDTHDDRRDGIIAFITRTWKGDDLAWRITSRVRTFADEVTTISIAGFLLGLTAANIVASVIESMRDPWKNPLLVELREKVRRGEIALPSGLDIDERHYGQGVPISSLTALTDITRFAVGEGWNWYDYEENKNRAKGYFVFRGSSYPCDECDSHVGYHPVEDTDSLPLFHKHCCCYVVWV